MFYRDSSSSCIFFFLFVSYPPNSLNGTQPKLAICAEVSAIRKCPKSGGQIGGPRTTFFSTTSQLNGNFNCMTPLLSRTISERFRDEFMIKRYTNRRHFTLMTYIFHAKCMIYIIGQVRWKLQEVSYIVSKSSQNVMNFGPQTA